MSATTFGRYFAEIRRDRLGMSLREFCEKNGLDPGNTSRLERGKLAPPKSREALSKYAAALKLDEGTDEWLQFFDLAAASRGELPEDLMSDEKVVEQLPVLFRTLRGERLTEDKLKRLIEVIRDS